MNEDTAAFGVSFQKARDCHRHHQYESDLTAFNKPKKPLKHYYVPFHDAAPPFEHDETESSTDHFNAISSEEATLRLAGKMPDGDKFTRCVPRGSTDRITLESDCLKFGRDVVPVPSDVRACDKESVQYRCQGLHTSIGQWTACHFDQCTNGRCTAIQDDCARRNMKFPSTSRQFLDCKNIGKIGTFAGKCVRSEVSTQNDPNSWGEEM